MISRSSKAVFYFSLGPLMRLNGWLHRNLRAPRKGTVKVHLGPGRKNYLAGWINVDANCFTAKCDVWANLNNALPFPDNTVDVFYSHHVIEHLPDALLPFHFREMFRCLKNGGVVRVGGPNGDSAMRKYVEGDVAWFSDFPDKRGSLGGRLANFILCRGEHLAILTPSYLTELAGATGLVNLQICLPAKQTHYPTSLTRKF